MSRALSWPNAGTARYDFPPVFPFMSEHYPPHNSNGILPPCSTVTDFVKVRDKVHLNDELCWTKSVG